MEITCKRTDFTALDGVYCVEPFFTKKGLRIVTASEIHGGHCKSISFDTGAEETVWTGPGGCMNVAQLDEAGSLVAVQNFYQGGQATDAQIVRAQKTDEGWQTDVLAKLPYLHHCGVVYAHGDAYVIASTLCTHREYKGDWSHPGRIQVLRVPQAGETAAVEVIQEGVTKNHGFWQGTLDGAEVTLISGTALYCVRPPLKKGGAWRVEKLIDREMSDIAVVDFDGDGEDEILSFEGLHGNTAAINKRINGVWKIVATCPMEFSHAIWGGTLLEEPCFVVGSMQGDGALKLLRKAQGESFALEVTVLAEGIGASNCRGLHYKGNDYVLAVDKKNNTLALLALHKA